MAIPWDQTGALKTQRKGLKTGTTQSFGWSNDAYIFYIQYETMQRQIYMH